MSADFGKKIGALKMALPPAPKPAGSYQPLLLCGDMAYLSGQVSKTADGKIIAGKVGSDLTLEEGKGAARAAALNVLSILQNLLGWKHFVRLVRVVGYVQADPHFYDIPQVVNGASDLFLEVFGDRGIHARSAVGMASLPLNAAVELEVTLQIRPKSNDFGTLAEPGRFSLRRP